MLAAHIEFVYALNVVPDISKTWEKLDSCLACSSTKLEEILNLGPQALANNYTLEQGEQDKYPLALNLCLACFHSQLNIAIFPDILFKQYSYVSGTSTTLADYFFRFKKKIIGEHGESGKILDIGSNDGSFLANFANTEWFGLGVDPAYNLIPESIKRGVVTVPIFFDERITKFLADDFDVVVAMNVFAHTSNPSAMLKSISSILKPDGHIYIQTSQADMIFTGQFDTVYHEHINFFNVKSMRQLLRANGLHLVDVTIEDIHGGSYLWQIQKGAGSTNLVFERESKEKSLGLYEKGTYLRFKEKSLEIVERVKSTIEQFRNDGYAIASYGAAAKGNTFLNFGEITLDYIFDDTPQKIGRYAPAGGCIVSSSSTLADINSPMIIIIPAWNFSAEIVKKIRERRKGFPDYYLQYFPDFTINKV